MFFSDTGGTSIYKHMVEKFCDKEVKNGNFSNQMEFRKKSIV